MTDKECVRCVPFFPLINPLHSSNPLKGVPTTMFRVVSGRYLKIVLLGRSYTMRDPDKIMSCGRFPDSTNIVEILRKLPGILQKIFAKNVFGRFGTNYNNRRRVTLKKGSHGTSPVHVTPYLFVNLRIREKAVRRRSLLNSNQSLSPP